MLFEIHHKLRLSHLHRDLMKRAYIYLSHLNNVFSVDKKMPKIQSCECAKNIGHVFVVLGAHVSVSTPYNGCHFNANFA